MTTSYPFDLYLYKKPCMIKVKAETPPHDQEGNVMTVYGLWYGGSSYSQSEVNDDTEVFLSVRDAGLALRSRCQGHTNQIFRYADGRGEYGLTPCVDEKECSMWVFFSDPRGIDDPYPDRVLSIGPRGGIRSERS